MFIAKHPLASRNKTGAFNRWLRWQLSSRILKTPAVIPFVENSVLVVESGMAGATGNIYCGLNDFEDMTFVMHALRPLDLFVDVGANVGSYSVLAAKVAAADCFSFEPVPSTFAKLQRNLRINDLGSHVRSFQFAVGSGSGMLHFSADQDTTNRAVKQDYRGQAIEVPVNSLDNILDGRLPFMMKVDVEGFEGEVLAGAEKSLKAPSLHAILLEGDDSRITDTMESAGFMHATYNPFSRELLGGRYAGGDHHNHLWIRGLKQVQERCKEARRFMVAGHLI